MNEGNGVVIWTNLRFKEIIVLSLFTFRILFGNQFYPVQQFLHSSSTFLAFLTISLILLTMDERPF